MTRIGESAFGDRLEIQLWPWIQTIWIIEACTLISNDTFYTKLRSCSAWLQPKKGCPERLRLQPKKGCPERLRLCNTLQSPVSVPCPTEYKDPKHPRPLVSVTPPPPPSPPQSYGILGWESWRTVKKVIWIKRISKWIPPWRMAYTFYKLIKWLKSHESLKYCKW